MTKKCGGNGKEMPTPGVRSHSGRTTVVSFNVSLNRSR